MIRFHRACRVAAGVFFMACVGCGDDAPPVKPVSKEGQAIPEGKTADPNAMPKPKAGGGGRTPRG